MRPAITLHIPQPCAESWDAMKPTATGRHCAACAHPVVDFTLKTDAEILAYMARAAGGRTCGRFAAGQLERPLQRAALVAPKAWWRAWLAAAVAVWAVREGLGSAAKAQTATEWRARYWGGPLPAVPTVASPAPLLGSTAVSPAAAVEPKALSYLSPNPAPPQHVAALKTVPLVLRGRITDFSTNQGLPGATVLLKGSGSATSTTQDGSYELPVPAALASAPALTISVSSIGFMGQERTLATRTAGLAQAFQLQADVKGKLGEVVVMSCVSKRLPAPWHPRAFYFWSKYWLTRPFHRR